MGEDVQSERRRRALPAVLVALALGLAPGCAAADREAVAPGEKARADFDPRWLDPLGLPDTTGRPLVAVVVSGTETPFAAMLLVDEPHRFVVFDGLRTTTFARWNDGEGPPRPPGVEFAEARPIGGAAATSLLGHLRGPPAEGTLRKAVFAVLLAQRGEHRAASALRGDLVPRYDEPRAYLRGTVASYLVAEAVRAYGVGSAPGDLRRSLERAARIDGTAAAELAVRMLSALRAPPPPPSPSQATPLDSLIEARIAALVERPCRAPPDPEADPPWGGRPPPPADVAVERLRALGVTATPALEAHRGDRRLSRCEVPPADGLDWDEGGICKIDPKACGPGAPHPPGLATVGELVAKALVEKGRPAPETSDVECGPRVDPEALGLVESALGRGDPATAIVVTERARGSLRVRAVAALGQADGDVVDAFLAREAAGGPVLMARVEATRALGRRGRPIDGRTIASAIVDALAADDDGGPPRCDQRSLVFEGLDVLGRYAGGDLVAAATARFDHLGPEVKVLVLRELDDLRNPGPATAEARERLFERALADTRPVPRPSWAQTRLSSCPDVTASDVAAAHLARVRRVKWSCGFSDPQKADALRAIRERSPQQARPGR